MENQFNRKQATDQRVLLPGQSVLANYYVKEVQGHIVSQTENVTYVIDI